MGTRRPHHDALAMVERPLYPSLDRRRTLQYGVHGGSIMMHLQWWKANVSIFVSTQNSRVKGACNLCKIIPFVALNMTFSQAIESDGDANVRI